MNTDNLDTCWIVAGEVYHATPVDIALSLGIRDMKVFRQLESAGKITRVGIDGWNLDGLLDKTPTPAPVATKSAPAPTPAKQEPAKTSDPVAAIAAGIKRDYGW